MFDYEKLFEELKRNGFKQNHAAQKIGIDPNTLSKKITGKINQELSGTQIAIICDMIGSPMDMFVKKGDNNER